MKRFVTLGVPVVAAVLVSLTACQPTQNKTQDSAAAALRQAGYARAPEVTAVEEVPTGFIVSGLANEKGRIQIVYSGQNAIGQNVTSTIGGPVNGKGQFSAPVPSGRYGGLYDLQADDPGQPVAAAARSLFSEAADPLPPREALVGDRRGRWLHAEGKLFVPLGHPDKAAILRAGGASYILSGEKSLVGVVDYDGGGGLSVTGQVTPGTTVELLVDNTIIGQTQSKADGRYHVTGQIPVPSDALAVLALEITAGKATMRRVIPVSRPQPGNRVTPLSPGWRIDWALPGGGMQTTIVF
ncbi:hypothetical protein [Asticcacaulis sp. AC402]|uniref:hypothetical protein n=1 Tax=Asticcacaulis sp. AC402 TaxID=1282361 RepID=UPI0004CE8604|nr:hypothetical protein [Asticcacaulis sp. AC402]